MPLRLLVVSIVSVSMAAFGQTTAGTPQPSPTDVVGGFVGYTGAAGGVLLSTPSASFASPQPTAGISDSGHAGITDATPANTGVQESLNSATMVYYNVPLASSAAISPAIGAPSAVTTARGPVNDLGRASYNDAIHTPNATGPSLAEVAARYKGLQNTQNVKTYTNADVPRQNSGRLGSEVLAANTPPPLPQSAASQSAAAPPTASPQQPPASGQPETQSQSAIATTPQIRQSQPATEGVPSSLPATSTFLPLLGLLGVLSGGVGIWYRRKRK